MIPLFAVVRIEPRRGRRIRLWLPLFLIWLLLLVLGVLLSPLILLACLITRLNPFQTIWNLIGVVGAMAGTHIEVEAPNAMILVRIV